MHAHTSRTQIPRLKYITEGSGKCDHISWLSSTSSLSTSLWNCTLRSSIMASIGKSVVRTTSILLVVLVMVASSVEATRTLDEDPAGVRYDEDDTPEGLTTVQVAACAILGLPCGSEEFQCRANGVKCRFNQSCCSGYCSYSGGYICKDRAQLQCRANGVKCRFNQSCCSGYCSYSGGYVCKARGQLEREIGACNWANWEMIRLEGGPGVHSTLCMFENHGRSWPQGSNDTPLILVYERLYV